MYVRNCKENAPIYMYYVASETPMTSSVIVNCPDLAPPPQYFGQVYAYVCTYLCAHVYTTGHWTTGYITVYAPGNGGPCRLDVLKPTPPQRPKNQIHLAGQQAAVGKVKP